MHHRLIIAAALMSSLAMSCGKDGSSGGGGGAPPVDPPPVVPDPLGLRTTVGIDGMAYGLKGLTACLDRDDGPALPQLAAVTIDGDLGEWSAVPTEIADPVGDAPTATDLGYGAVASVGEDLAIGLGAVGSGTSVYLEIGGVTPRNGDLTQVVRRVLRISGSTVEDVEAGVFRAVGSDLARAMLSSVGGEVLLTRRLLGDVVTHPIWWLRVFTRAGAQAGDSTGAQYFPSMLNSDDPPFATGRCVDWMGRRATADLIQIRDARAEDAEFPLAQTAERVYELTRVAVDATTALLGVGSVPVGQIAAFATLRPVSAVTDATGFGLDQDPVAQGYRGVILDARQLGPASTETFPQGRILQIITTQIIEMLLRREFPAATDAMVIAWREALLDQLTWRLLGLNYWLDTYADRLGDTLPLQPLAAGEAVNAARALGFGRLAGRMLEPVALMAAWRAAHAQGGDPLTSLIYTTSRSSSDAVRRDMQSLWSGWFEAGDFAATFAPSVLSDSDLDGVPNHMERRNGTASDRGDTDNDGWTDLSELVRGTDPTIAGKIPGVIMPDGEFSDWQQLMPKRLIVDRGESGKCPKAADVEFYAAIATRDELIIGAVASEYWENEPRARWEVEIDLPKRDEQRLVTGVSGSHEYLVRDAKTPDNILHRYQRAMPVARRTIEWSLQRQSLGLDTYFNAEEGVRLRLRTLFKVDGEELLCDETDWFSPLISGDTE